MRLLTYALGVALLVMATSAAQANTINFGSPTDNTTCSLAGSVGDRSCTHAATVSNGANDATASLAIVGQASADQSVTLVDPDAIVDMTVSYTVPYTVTRDWYTTVGPNPQLVIPNQTITLNLNFGGEVSKDNSQATGGLGQASLIGGATVSSARFGSVVLGGTINQTGGGGLARTPFNYAVPDITGLAGRNFDDFTGEGDDELSFNFQIPLDYQDFEDNLAPNLMPFLYTTPYSGTQSFTDTLTITFRLRAESRPSGSVSATGGEALACAGQTSPLGSFDLNTGASCDSGLTVAASVVQTGTTSELVPEPGTLMLIGSGLAGLVAFGAGRRRS